MEVHDNRTEMEKSEIPETCNHWSQPKDSLIGEGTQGLSRSKSLGLDQPPTVSNLAAKPFHLPPLEAIFDTNDYLQSAQCAQMRSSKESGRKGVKPNCLDARPVLQGDTEDAFSKRLLISCPEESQEMNNRVNDRSSFDMLVSGRDAPEERANRRHSESNAMPFRGRPYAPRYPTQHGSVADSLRAPLLISGHQMSKSKERKIKDLEGPGILVNSEPTIQRRRFRAGPSVGAHASQLVDQHTQKTHPITIIDADLHDTFGAHDWMPSKPKDLGQNVRRSGVSKAPTLSPIRSQLNSPVGSPVTSPQRNFVTSNVSYLSRNYLERRKLAQLYPKEGDSETGRGYIAEAKRVLDEAMHLISRNPSDGANEICMSNSGALDPLLKHLKSVAGDNAKCRAALRTLTLLETNLPNRQIISDLQGRRILMDVVLKCTEIDVQEKSIQLLWDLDLQAGRNAAAILNEQDLLALGEVLCSTTECEIASHTIHFLKFSLDQPPETRPFISSATRGCLASNLTSEACAHKHHLPDAAQYCLGETLGVVLSDLASVDVKNTSACLEKVLGSLMECRDDTQCQVLLTVLSSLAVRRKLRGILGELGALERVLSFTENNQSGRLQARGFSLLKALSNKAARNPVSSQGSWYFDDCDHLD